MDIEQISQKVFRIRFNTQVFHVLSILHYKYQLFELKLEQEKYTEQENSRTIFKKADHAKCSL